MTIKEQRREVLERALLSSRRFAQIAGSETGIGGGTQFVLATIALHPGKVFYELDRLVKWGPTELSRAIDVLREKGFVTIRKRRFYVV
jgi:hypothetical protein